jgi:DNA-binding XRE family transcriptional regulator
MVDSLQVSLRSLRNLMGYSINEFAEIIGVTRQTINNLESGKSKLTATQYIAFSAIIDNFTEMNPSMYKAVENIIDGNHSSHYSSSFTNLSLLKRWFSCFESDVSNRLMISNDDVLTYQDLCILARNYKVFIDYTALMSDNANEVLRGFSSIFSKENAKFTIPVKVVEEIQHHISDADYNKQAINALKLINEFQRQNIVDLRGEHSDTNARDTILSVFAKFRSVYRLLLLTQDENFAKQVLNLNNNTQGFRIVVGFLDEDKVKLYSENQSTTDSGIDLSLVNYTEARYFDNKDVTSVDDNNVPVSWSDL